jgi:poly(3-hydroxybutyrate) depolymerase
MMRLANHILLAGVIPLIGQFVIGSTVAGDEAPATIEGQTVSRLDNVQQSLLAWAPASADSQPTPLFVFLHSWSSDYRQDNSKWLRACADRGWIWLHPDFRGINQTPQACGSKFARQDVLDAIDWARSRWQVDSQRIYLAGVSGGGHMALLMAGHHPERFSAVSAWVGPTDLAAWHAFHCQEGTPDKYATMIEQCLGGPPGTSAAVDSEYVDRSPVHHLHRTGDLPVSIWAGVNDGHTGSVPVSHSLLAFNAIARGRRTPLIGDAEIDQLLHYRRLTIAMSGDNEPVIGLDRLVLLHRSSGPSEIIVFDGGHESLPAAAMQWLAMFARGGL